jgi:hypothetical protein
VSNTTHTPRFADSESSVRDTATGQFVGTVSRPGEGGVVSGRAFLSCCHLQQKLHNFDPKRPHLPTSARQTRPSIYISLTPLPTIHQPTAPYAQPSETSPTQADPKCNHSELPLAPEEQVPGILQRDGISAGMLCSMPPPAAAKMLSCCPLRSTSVVNGPRNIKLSAGALPPTPRERSEQGPGRLRLR